MEVIGRKMKHSFRGVRMIIFQCDTEADGHLRSELTAITREASCKVKPYTSNASLSAHREQRKRRRGAKETVF